jgi:HEAT repeat protein
MAAIAAGPIPRRGDARAVPVPRGRLHPGYTGAMPRFRPLPAVLLATALLLAGRVPALAFDWLGKVEYDAAALRSSDPQQRLHAVQRLGRYDIALTRSYLLAALRDPDTKVRGAAGRILARSKVAGAAAIVVEWLADPDPTTKQLAAEILGELGTPSAVPPLIRALGDVEPRVRLRAVTALGQIGGAAVVVPLIGRLEDDKPEVRRAAVEQLSRLADPRAVIPLIGNFDDSSLEVRIAAVTAVGRLGEGAAVPALLRLLRDPAEPVKLAAVTALGNLHAREATAVLVAELPRGSDEYRAKVAYALGQLAQRGGGPEVQQAVEPLVAALADPRLRIAAREALRNAGPAAVPALVAHLEGTAPGDPEAAVNLLKEIGDARATTVLIRELERGRLHRQLVLEALSRTRDTRALVPVLGLLSDSAPEVRIQAMRALRPLLPEDARAADVLVDMLGDPDIDIQVMAAEYLGLVRSRAAVDKLVTLAGSSRNLRLRAAAVAALGEIGDRRGAAVLLDVLERGAPALHRAAATSLIYLADPRTAAPLRGLLERSELPASSRDHAVRALGGILRRRPDRRSRELVEELAEAEPAGLALSAIAALGAMADRASVPVLLRLARSPHLARRRAALEALGNLRDRRSLAPLRTALRAASDRIAATAAWALAKSGDAAELEILLHATRHPGWATPINASAALALHTPAARAQLLIALTHHKNRFVRANAIHGLLRGGAAASAAAPLRTLLRRDDSWLVRVAAARALAATGGAEDALRKAAQEDGNSRVRDAARATLEGRFTPPRRSTWRSFYFVDPALDDAPVAEEPYFIVAADGLVTAYFSDARGEAGEEWFPPGDYTIAPRARSRQF